MAPLKEMHYIVEAQLQSIEGEHRYQRVDSSYSFCPRCGRACGVPALVRAVRAAVDVGEEAVLAAVSKEMGIG